MTSRASQKLHRPTSRKLEKEHPRKKSASRSAVNLAKGRENPAKYKKANNEKGQQDKKNKKQQSKKR